MKLKISFSEKTYHKSPVACIGWYTNEEVYSTSDDNQLLSYSISTNSPSKIAKFNKELCPTDLQFLPRSIGSENGSKSGEIILITSADGKFHILTRLGRIERSIEAHKGAILVGQWNCDGTNLLTGGEDGFIKIWSRSGMLRSTLINSENSIYSATWSPDSNSIAYTQGKFIVIKQLAPNTKPIKWKAHDGLVLTLAWSSATELLVSGGEDCRYRVWDQFGKQIYSSQLHENHITTISWSPRGDLFAVGSFDTLRLCDRSGWSRCLEKVSAGSIYKLQWSFDGTQIAAGCANGQLLFGSILQRNLHYKNFNATLTERKTVQISDCLDNNTTNTELLEFPDRVVQMAFKFDHLVLTTLNQCYIYSTKNWNTPIIFELKENCSNMLLLAENHMLIVEKTSANLYNYQGRLLTNVRWPKMHLETLKLSQISLCSDCLVVRDSIDQKIIYFIDLVANRSASNAHNCSKIVHQVNVAEISLDQYGSAQFRTLAVLDKTKDLYVVELRSQSKKFCKLSRKIENFKWNSEENLMAGMQDEKLVVWYCTKAASFDNNLIKLCSFQHDSSEFGKNPRVEDFIGNLVEIRRSDGSIINVHILPFPTILLKFMRGNDWSSALNFCRTVNNSTLWACLAVSVSQLSSNENDLEMVNEISKEAFANIDHFDKVFFLDHVKNLSLDSKTLSKANLMRLSGKLHESESVLLNNGMVFQAIFGAVQTYDWSRALEIALKHKTQVDIVLYLREKYLKNLGKGECNANFKNAFNTFKFEHEKVKEKFENEVEKLSNVNIPLLIVD